MELNLVEVSIAQCIHGEVKVITACALAVFIFYSVIRDYSELLSKCLALTTFLPTQSTLQYFSGAYGRSKRNMRKLRLMI